jgi:hypothetical protein
VGGLVGGLLELVFWPPLPKSGVGGQVGGPVGDALPGTLYHALFEIELFSKKKTSALLEKYHASYRRCLACIMVENTSYNLTTWNQRMCKVYFSSLNICYSSKVNLP